MLSIWNILKFCHTIPSFNAPLPPPPPPPPPPHTHTHTQAFLAHLSTECSVSYCDHSPSIVVRPSDHNFLVNTLAFTNINQSAPNLVRMYMTIRSQMSSIMEGSDENCPSYLPLN